MCRSSSFLFLIMSRIKSLSLALLLAAPMFALAGGQHEHGHAQPGTDQPLKIELNGGVKWSTDPSLQKGMAAIREATAATIASVDAGKATDATFTDTAQRIDRELAYIVNNCKLEPAADAQLHVLISRMMAFSEVMAGKAPGKPRMAGLHRMMEALNAYGTHFAHPGWRRLEH